MLPLEKFINSKLAFEKFKTLLVKSGYKNSSLVDELAQIVEGYDYFHTVIGLDNGCWEYMRFDKTTGNLIDSLEFDAYASAMLAFAQGIAEEVGG